MLISWLLWVSSNLRHVKIFYQRSGVKQTKISSAELGWDVSISGTLITWFAIRYSFQCLFTNLGKGLWVKGHEEDPLLTALSLSTLIFWIMQPWSWSQVETSACCEKDFIIRVLFGDLCWLQEVLWVSASNPGGGMKNCFRPCVVVSGRSSYKCGFLHVLLHWVILMPQVP